MSASIKERRAVVVNDPLELARNAFGSVSNANRVLQLPTASFYNWRSARGIPLTVYRVMEALATNPMPSVDSLSIVDNPRPFKISSPVIRQKKKELGPYRRGKATPTVATAPPSPDLVERLARLEAESAAIRERFNRLVAVLG